MVFKTALTVQQTAFINVILANLVITTRILESRRFMQHGNTSVYEHSLGVARLSMKIASFFHIHVDDSSLIRGALLHDYFLYDWHEKGHGHWHGFTHPAIAFSNASRDCSLTPVESDVIRHHMFPLTPMPPLTREGILVCIADKICGIRETFKRK